MTPPVQRGDVFWANKEDSKALTEQIRAMDKQRLTTRIGILSPRFLRLIEQAIRNSLDM